MVRSRNKIFILLLYLSVLTLIIFNTGCYRNHPIQYRMEHDYYGKEVKFHMYIKEQRLEKLMKDSGKTEEEVINQQIKETLIERDYCFDEFIIDRKSFARGGNITYSGHFEQCSEQTNN